MIKRPSFTRYLISLTCVVEIERLYILATLWYLPRVSTLVLRLTT
jgi:hypothetical protein